MRSTVFGGSAWALLCAVALSPSTQAATEWKFWPSAALGVYRDGNVLAVGSPGSTTTSDEVVRFEASFDVTAKRPETTEFKATYSPYREWYNEQTDLDSTSHRLSMSLSHEISRRSSFNLGLGGTLTDRQQVQVDRPDRPTTLVPRTRQTNAYLDLNGRVATGKRSFFDWGAGGDILAYELEVLQDTSSYWVSLGTGFEVGRDSALGLRVRGQRLELDATTPAPPDVGLEKRSVNAETVEGFYDVKFHRSATLSLQLGAIRSVAESTPTLPSSTSTDPKVGVDLSYTFLKGTVLSGGLRQDVSAGWGGGSATLDRGAYVSASPGTRTHRLVTVLSAYYWRREALVATNTADDLGTFEGLASLAWQPGRGHFAFGGFYSYHNQTDLQGSNPGLEARYSSGGVFVRWAFRVESERPS